MRLGVYNDGRLQPVDTDDGRRIASAPTDFPFFTFACAVGRNFESTLLFARRERDCFSTQPLLPHGIGLAELPAYDSLLRVGQVARSIPGTLRGFWRGLSKVDVVWVLGPHPLAFLLIGLALVRRRQVVLGVRQDTMAYFRSRVPNSRWKPAILAAQVWDLGFRALGRILKTTVVGDELSQAYGRKPELLLTMNVSPIRDQDVVTHPTERDWTGTIDLLTVGRIDREKNPLLLVEAMAALQRVRPGRYRLVWVGTGPMKDLVAQRIHERGLDDRLDLLGFLPFGPQLLEHYRRAHVFVHVSLTEGVPAVLIEALASGTPIVATAVGGVAASLGDGQAGLLVPPSDVDALVAALVRVVEESGHRDRRVKHGLELAHQRTLDAQAARVAQFIRG